jgi:hypothetical protein
MPRNMVENVYVTIAFARDSITWQRLQREADELDISIAHLIKTLLADRVVALEGHGKHLWFPREVDTARTLPAVPQLSPPSVSQVEDTASMRLTTAAAAASYWDD